MGHATMMMKMMFGEFNWIPTYLFSFVLKVVYSYLVTTYHTAVAFTNKIQAASSASQVHTIQNHQVCIVCFSHSQLVQCSGSTSHGTYSSRCLMIAPSLDLVQLSATYPPQPHNKLA